MDMQFCAQPNFASAFAFAHGQETAMHYPEDQYPLHTGYPGMQYIYGYQQPRGHLMSERGGLNDCKTESKPRLSKEEVEKLEKVFQENPKPSSSIKAQLADGLGLERPRINNWFQNRRAKAKQERKQEEYEARQAAEKATSTNAHGAISSKKASDEPNETETKRVHRSSAVFPSMSAVSHAANSSDSQHDEEEDEDEDEDEDDEEEYGALASPDDYVLDSQRRGSLQSDATDESQTPLSLGFSHDHTDSDFAHSTSIACFSAFSSAQQPSEHVSQLECSTSFESALSPGKRQPSTHQYLHAINTDLPSAQDAPFFQTQYNIDTPSLSGSSLTENDTYNGVLDITHGTDQSAFGGSPTISLDLDSFKTPPPPANIASRRNIPRPAALQAACLRSRSYNVGYGPKTAFDRSRRGDAPSPVTAMRRISSATGTGTGSGRIQKSSMAPRSPMFFARHPEALLPYHCRSPVGLITPRFHGATPPTPMTPVVLDQQTMREPAVSSNCSDDGSFMLGIESNLKTPPKTPGLMTHFTAQTFAPNLFNTNVDFSVDQPLLTPYFRTDFSDLSFQTPNYAELSDGSLPTTPLYPDTMESTQGHGNFTGTAMNTQYDWDANESVISPRSSPDQSRAKQIQFTQNITPQDYTGV